MIAFPLELWPVGLMPRGLFPDDPSRYEVLRVEDAGEDVLAAAVPLDQLNAVVTGPDLSDELYYVRAYNRANLSDRDSIDYQQQRVAFDEAGVLILPVPPAPVSQQLIAAADGEVLAQWLMPRRIDQPAAASYHLYVATGADSFDFAAPTTTATPTGRPLQVSLGTFAHGTVVRCVIRAVSSQGAEEANTASASITADAQAPEPVAALALEVTPS